MVEEKEITSVPQDNDNSDHMPQEISKPESQLGAGVDVDELIKNGRRNLACEELPQAVEALAEACQILADEHGDQADRLAEPYYYYGKALLELARAENGVLGNALDGVPTEEENEADLSESDQFGKASEVREEERDELRDQIFEAMSAETQSENPTDEGISTAEEKSTEELKSTEDSKPTDESKSTEGDNSPTGRLKSVETENPADAVSADVADPASVEESARGEADPAVGDEMESAGEEEDLETSQDEDTVEDIPNLQLAWEVLELSKRIYSKLSESQPELQRKLADVHMLLGEVGEETRPSQILSCVFKYSNPVSANTIGSSLRLTINSERLTR